MRSMPFYELSEASKLPCGLVPLSNTLQAHYHYAGLLPLCRLTTAARIETRGRSYFLYSRALALHGCSGSKMVPNR